MPDNDSLETKKLNAEIQKLAAETQKLSEETTKIQNEIIEQRKKPWKKAQYIAAWLPFLATLITAFILWFNGAIDKRKHELRAERAILQYQIVDFQRSRDSLLIRLGNLKDSVKSLSKDKDELDTLFNSIVGSDSLSKNEIDSTLSYSNPNSLKALVYKLRGQLADAQHEKDLADIKYEKLLSTCK